RHERAHEDTLGEECPAPLRRPAVLPGERGMDRPPGSGLPDDGRAALAAETEPPHSQALGLAEDRTDDLADRPEGGLGIVLDQPGTGMVGEHLAVRLAARRPRRIEEQRADPGGPHVESDYRVFSGPLTHRLRF